MASPKSSKGGTGYSLGWLLAEAVKADIGTFAKSNDAYLADLSDGAGYALNLIGVYAKPEFDYVGP